MLQQQTHPIVVPENQWLGELQENQIGPMFGYCTQLEWMLIRKGYRLDDIFNLSEEGKLAELEKHYVINDLDIRQIQEQEAAGNYFLMSLYVNTMVFDKEAL